MTRTMKNLIEGAKEALTLKASTDYSTPTRGGFHKDSLNFKGDIRKIGSDFRKSANAYKVSK